ncbi:MAG: hypothetical protein HND44_07980 [Chloroflexi bacterium]|nr:hypothetical protein [Ardenticatenaceae bacterium]NOG34503.1 hypothetical protein [Chloroflexota bacterium]
MKITLEPNSNGDEQTVPFHVRVDIVTATIDAGSAFYVPVEMKYQGMKKSFAVNIAGWVLESERPEALPDKISRFLPRLISLARLPTYLFIARRAGGIYPVYTIGSEVYATTPGGPVFRHVELAKVREYLTDYLHAAGVLGEKGLSDKLHVRGLNMKTLGLRHPIFYLKKRVPGEVDFWAPVFEASDGNHIYCYAADERREATINSGLEVLELQQTVAAALKTDRRLRDTFDLRPDRLFPEVWEQLKAGLRAGEPIVVNGLTLPAFAIGDIQLALEERPDEGRYSLYLGHDADDLRTRVAVDLERRGISVISNR